MGEHTILERIQEAVRRCWGHHTLRPLQAEAIEAELSGRDSLVVMPTGGGKSLCYEAPPLISGGLSVVVSPLIALMRDQVGGLRARGYPAVTVHSTQSADEQAEQLRILRSGSGRLLYVAPERLLTEPFLGLLSDLSVQRFAIDEAHCVSHWGHDFRPEYRQLTALRERFQAATFHAYTATATPRVQQDICNQLALVHPTVLVGDFDRPNLTYRVVPRLDLHQQVAGVLRSIESGAAIVYCLTRQDTVAMSAALNRRGIAAQPYHAGLPDGERHRTQDAFSCGTLDVVCATVAFGMGIDRPDVRAIVHAGMPQSIEHYQQETGRAGRDGASAQCVLFYSAEDVLRWQSLIRRAAATAERPDEVIAIRSELLAHMHRLCTSKACRHRGVVAHFGQAWSKQTCQACDICLGETRSATDGTRVARDILSCVARLGQSFGATHVADVLVGRSSLAVRERGHQALPCHGVLSEVSRRVVVNWIYQLIDQRLLIRTAGDRPVLHLTPRALDVLGGERDVELVRVCHQSTGLGRDGWDHVDQALYERLRACRLELARERGLRAFQVCSNAVLRRLATERPASRQALRATTGVGDRTVSAYGDAFLDVIRLTAPSQAANSGC